MTKRLIKWTASLTLVVLFSKDGETSEDVKSRIVKAQGVFFHS